MAFASDEQGSLGRQVVQPLEDDLQRQLHVERLTDADARCAPGAADGIRHASETVAAQSARTNSRPSIIGCEGVGARRCPVVVVEEVEELEPELCVDPLRNLRVLDQ